jgi:predicted DNA-binding antitoxin AbrB/MazE fold protein
MEVRSVQAIFEDGFLRPSEDLGLQEHERVRLIVTSEAEWQRKFAALLEQVQSKTDSFAADESRPLRRTTSPPTSDEARRD